MEQSQPVATKYIKISFDQGERALDLVQNVTQTINQSNLFDSDLPRVIEVATTLALRHRQLKILSDDNKTRFAFYTQWSDPIRAKINMDKLWEKVIAKSAQLFSNFNAREQKNRLNRLAHFSNCSEAEANKIQEELYKLCTDAEPTKRYQPIGGIFGLAFKETDREYLVTVTLDLPTDNLARTCTFAPNFLIGDNLHSGVTVVNYESDKIFSHHIPNAESIQPFVWQRGINTVLGLIVGNTIRSYIMADSKQAEQLSSMPYMNLTSQEKIHSACFFPMNERLFLALGTERVSIFQYKLENSVPMWDRVAKMESDPPSPVTILFHEPSNDLLIHTIKGIIIFLDIKKNTTCNFVNNETIKILKVNKQFIFYCDDKNLLTLHKWKYLKESCSFEILRSRKWVAGDVFDLALGDNAVIIATKTGLSFVDLRDDPSSELATKVSWISPDTENMSSFAATQDEVLLSEGNRLEIMLYKKV